MSRASTPADWDGQGLSRGGRTGPDGRAPALLPADGELIRRELLARARAFTPDWAIEEGDPGSALIRVFSEMLLSAVERLNRLPEKAEIEVLNAAGAEPGPATVASALLEFTASAATRGPVLVPRGFPVAGPSAADDGGLVVFETEDELYVTSAELVAARSVVNGAAVDVTLPRPDSGEEVLLFGSEPSAGRSFWLGFGGTQPPREGLSLGFDLAQPDRAPEPVSAGGPQGPRSGADRPTLTWSIYTGRDGQFQPAEVVRDTTGRLDHSGVVSLRLPREAWALADPLGRGLALYWLRVELGAGPLARAPRLRAVRRNVVEAVALRTVRDEVVEREAEPDEGGRASYRLRETPVRRGTVRLVVRTGITPRDEQAWTETDDLDRAGPGDRVFQLADPAHGRLRFGDGVRGAPLPDGFGVVVARSYRAGGGRAGAVDAGTLTTTLASVPGLIGASNPAPATGGADAEPLASVLRRGPAELRTGDRAVTAADMEALALRADGARVRRARALPGFHPGFPGRPRPGVVGVLIVPDRPDAESPPIAGAAELDAVARFLSRRASAGVEVVVAAPRFVRLKASLAAVFDPGLDDAESVRRLTADALTRFVSPTDGGPDGRGWPFGGTLDPLALTRHLVDSVGPLLGVERLTLEVDGLRLACAPVTLPRDALFWPDRPTVVPTPLSTPGARR